MRGLKLAVPANYLDNSDSRAGGERDVLTLSALLPDMPTVSEAGVPGYEATQWYGVLAPAGVPKPIVAKLNAEMVKAIKGADVRDKLAAEAAEPVGNTPEEFGAFIRKEIARWAPVVKASGARPE